MIFEQPLTICPVTPGPPGLIGFCKKVSWTPAKKGTSVTLDWYGLQSQLAVASSGREILILFLSNDATAQFVWLCLCPATL